MEISTLDAIIGDHSAALGSDVTPYRNHAYRVANLCLVQSPSGAETLERIAIAAAFHDLGIWTDQTFDYLAPSVRLASVWLARSGKAAWTQEIAEMILWHHKITQKLRPDSRAEALRQQRRSWRLSEPVRAHRPEHLEVERENREC